MEQQLGLSFSQAQEQACAAEHLLPDEVLKPLENFLNRAEQNKLRSLFGEGMIVSVNFKARKTLGKMPGELWFGLSWGLLQARKSMSSILAKTLGG